MENDDEFSALQQLEANGRGQQMPETRRQRRKKMERKVSFMHWAM
jgi:hypothetical protein